MSKLYKMSFLLKSHNILRATSPCRKIYFKQNLPICISNKNIFLRLLSTEASTHNNFEEGASPFNRIEQILKEKNNLSRGSIIELHKYTKAKGTVTPSQSLFMIRSCGFLNLESNVSRTTLLEQIWKTLLEFDVQLDVSHYNAALKCFVDNDHEFSSNAFLEDMTKRGIEPNRVTFNHLIHKLCKDGNVNEANGMLELMKEKDMAISRVVFNSFIIGNAKANDLEGSQQVVDFMKENGLQPDEETYFSLAQAYTEHKEYEKLEALLEECESKDLHLSDKSLFGLIHILANNNATEEIPKIINKISRSQGFHTLAMMCCVQLVQDGYYDIAYKVIQFKEKRGAQNMYAARFFPEKLVQYEAPLEDIIHYCNRLVEDGIHILALERAFETAAMFGKKMLALKLLQVMKKQNGTLRDHYFYPLFCIAGKGDILITLRDAQELGFMGNTIEKWTDIILPIFEPINYPLRTLFDILNLGFEKNIVYTSFISYLLYKNELEKAAILAREFPSSNIRYMGKVLAENFVATNNVEDTVAVARLLINRNLRNYRDNSKENDQEKYISVMKFLMSTISDLPKEELAQKLHPLLQGMKDNGVGISRASLEPLINRIGDDMTAGLESLLNDLVTTTCIYDEDFRLTSRSRPSNQGPKDDFQIFSDYIHNRNFEKAKQLLEIFEADNLELPPRLKSSSIDIFIRENNPAKIEEIFESLLDINYSFSPHKIIEYAKLLINEGRISDASKVLLRYSPEDGEWPEHLVSNQRDNALRVPLIGLFEDTIEKGDLNDLELIQNNLISRRFHEPSFIAGYTILYHLNKGDLESAVKSFVEISEKYNAVNTSVILLKACTEVEDTEKLQKVADIVASKLGRMQSMRLLAFASLKVGKYGPAEKIFKTPGLRDNGTMLTECETLLRDGNVEAAEKLLSFSVNIYNFNRKPLFRCLLNHYAHCQDTTKALELWTSIQEENDDPGQEFMHELAILLKMAGVAVPFLTPEKPVAPARSSLSHVQYHNDNEFEEFFIALNSKKFKEASQLLKKNRYSKWNYLHNLLIYKLWNNDMEEDAGKEAQYLLVKGGKLKNLNGLLFSLSLKGDSKSIEDLSTHYDKPPNVFQQALGHAYFNSKRMDEYLDKLSKITDESKLQPYFASICQALKENPDFEEKVVKCTADIPVEYKSRLWSCIWDYKFSLGHKEEAEEIYEKHLKDDNMFVHCHLAAKKNNDVQMMQDLLDILKRNPEKRKMSLNMVYTSYVDILRRENKIREAIEVLQQSLVYLALEDYPVLHLNMLKQAASEIGVIFPYELPKTQRNSRLQSNTSSDSSSSSSSDSN